MKQQTPITPPAPKLSEAQIACLEYEINVLQRMEAASLKHIAYVRSRIEDIRAELGGAPRKAVSHRETKEGFQIFDGGGKQ